MVLDLRPVDLHLLPGLRNMPVQLDNKSSDTVIKPKERLFPPTNLGLQMLFSIPSGWLVLEYVPSPVAAWLIGWITCTMYIATEILLWRRKAS